MILENYVTALDILKYIEKYPNGVSGRSHDLAQMVNFFVEQFRQQQGPNKDD